MSIKTIKLVWTCHWSKAKKEPSQNLTLHIQYPNPAPCQQAGHNFLFLVYSLSQFSSLLPPNKNSYLNASFRLHFVCAIKMGCTVKSNAFLTDPCNADPNNSSHKTRHFLWDLLLSWLNKKRDCVSYIHSDKVRTEATVEVKKTTTTYCWEKNGVLLELYCLPHTGS